MRSAGESHPGDTAPAFIRRISTRHLVEESSFSRENKHYMDPQYSPLFTANTQQTAHHAVPRTIRLSVLLYEQIVDAPTCASSLPLPPQLPSRYAAAIVWRPQKRRFRACPPSPRYCLFLTTLRVALLRTSSFRA